MCNYPSPVAASLPLPPQQMFMIQMRAQPRTVSCSRLKLNACACRQCNPIDFTTHCSHADCAPCDGCEEAVRFRDTAACAMWCDQSNAASHCPDDRCADCGFCQASSSTSSHGTAAAISPASRRANMALPSVPPSLYVPHTRPGAPCAPGTAPSHSGKIAKMPKPRGLLHLAVCMHMYTASRSLLQPPALSQPTLPPRRSPLPELACPTYACTVRTGANVRRGAARTTLTPTVQIPRAGAPGARGGRVSSSWIASVSPGVT